MNRRTVLIGTGVTLSAAIAGCAGSDPTSSDSQGSTNDGSDGQYMDDSGDSDDSDGDSGVDDANEQPISPAEGVLEVTDTNLGVEPDEEYVEFTNTADDPVDLTGAYVRDGDGGEVDNGRSPFRFPEDTAVLQPGESLRLWSGDGANNMYNLYWKFSDSIWDEDGDTIIIVYNNERVLEHTYDEIESSSQEDTESSSEDDDN